MGPQAKKKLLEDALGLPPEERADLAAELIASLDGPPDDDAETAWAAEIERRARRVLSGASEGRVWEEVRARIEDELKKK
jgi:putative addiction module component (TIGR02574 family)